MSAPMTAVLAAAPTVVVAGISSVSAWLLRGSDATRRRLAADAAIIESLPPAARAELRQSMGERAIQAVALTRYPLITGPDIVVAVLLFVVLAAAVSTYVPSLHTSPSTDLSRGGYAMSAAFPDFFAISFWYFIAKGWQSRGLARLAYLQAHLDDTVVAHAKLTLRIATSTLKTLAQVAITGTTIGLLLVYLDNLDHPSTFDKVFAGLGILFVAATAYATAGVGRTKELDKQLPGLADALGPGELLALVTGLKTADGSQSVPATGTGEGSPPPATN